MSNRNICRVAAPRKSYATGEMMYRLKGGPETVGDYEDWGYTQDGARRIAACWNACDGLSTEALERLGTLDRARVELDVIRNEAIAQRDELLAALQDANEALADRPLMDPTIIKIRAAIAKAAGGAA